MWFFLFAAGIIIGGVLPNMLALPLRLKEIGPVYADSAGGIIGKLQMTAAFVIPTFLVGTVAGTNYNLAFILACVIYLGTIPLIFLLPNINVNERHLKTSSESKLKMK